MNDTAMETVALELVAPGKGLLAVDESGPTIAKRFASIGVESTAETRRAYRELLLSTSGLGAFISGAILHDESLRQGAEEGCGVVALLAQQGIMPGVKVDGGTNPLAGFPGEKITAGLDGLRERLAEYRQLGARFTKWRAVITLGPEIPTAGAIGANMHALARFAALSQEAGLVPVVEPEVLMDGEHSLARHFAVTRAVLHSLYDELYRQRVTLAASLLKVNMVLAGAAAHAQPSIFEVAEATRRCMCESVPAAVPGIVFLSGGQEAVVATEHLDALNRLDRGPWELSFSFGRALQAPALRAWGGLAVNAAAAQAALLHRARCNSAARFGQYSPEMEVNAA